ncbi:hypothetical protein [Sphingobacterium faecium]
MKRKLFTFICLNSILYQTFFPLSALALTSGPVSPDASSFEPVDTSTMVNPITGDLVYNVPLLEVPGPEGSYPLSLSYHAGINPEQESSWVGLGWTLNPGSITRSLNGFPDDWANTEASRRDYWSGGETKVNTIGITVPKINLSLDFTKAVDTYLGVGYGWNIGYSFGLGGEKSPLSANIGIGSNPFSSGFSLTGGIGFSGFGAKTNNEFFKTVTKQNVSLTGSIGEVNGIGISVQSVAGLLGTSLSTSGGFDFPSRAIGASGSLSNSKEGSVSTFQTQHANNFMFFRFSSSRVQYWSDESETTKINGALNSSTTMSMPLSNDYANDSYSLPESSMLSDNIKEKDQGGAFPAFDNYSVTGQGIGGVMRPFLYQGVITNQNIIERGQGNSSVDAVKYSNFNTNPSKLNFRFVGDFSNSLLQDYPSYADNEASISHSDVPFSAINEEYINGTKKYDSHTQHLVGSKSIEYFKTDQDGNVLPSTKGSIFVKPVANGITRPMHIGVRGDYRNYASIAGFSITNESGMTYHYNLPAVSYEEEIYQENMIKEVQNDLRFNRQTKQAGYAYIWHLTAITGPDYVDRGEKGVLDEADYGYWVSFEYGKWSDEFVWRTPTLGYEDNFDQRFKTVSMGKKEVFYLDAVRTRTHTAFFEKDVRIDGKSSSRESFNKNTRPQGMLNRPVPTDYNNEGVYNINSHQSLSLSKIYIVKNSDVPKIDLSGGADMIPKERTIPSIFNELPGNILDKYDINAYGRSNLESKSLRIIDFNFDYTLANGTTTSFNYSNPNIKLGKLTLKSMTVRGKGGVGILPSTEFGYNLSKEDQKIAEGFVDADDRITSVRELYEIGDLIETDSPNPVYYGYVKKIIPKGNDEYDYIITGGNIMKRGLNRIRRTKNPIYQKDKSDYWGMYKSDYFTSNQNTNKIPTRNSNKSTDVWSLRKVKTITGSVVNFNYEGHDFEKNVFGPYRPLWFHTLDKESSGYFRLVNGNMDSNCHNFFQVGDIFSPYFVRSFGVKVRPTDVEYVKVNDLSRGGEVEVMEVNNNYILVKMSDAMEKNLFHIGDSRYSDTQVIGTNFLSTPNGKNMLGGRGIRVKSIMVNSLDGVKNYNEFSYKASESSKSSGGVIYEPLSFNDFPISVSKSDKNTFTSFINPGLDEILKYSAELPGSQVMYSRVASTSRVEYPDGANAVKPSKIVSEYYTFPDLKILMNTISSSSDYSTYSSKNLVLRKFISVIGSPKSISYYDSNDKMTKQVVRQYLHDGIEVDFFANYKTKLQQFGYQGLITERFSEVKNVYNTSKGSWLTKGTMVAREDYPIVNIGTVEYDYIHNIKTSTRINSFDFYSGAVSESISTDSYGNIFMNKDVPAYHNYVAMGPSQLNGNNKNMLTQIASSNMYRLNSQGAIESLVSANYNVWSNKGQVLNENGDVILQDGSMVGNGNVWRQTASYIWIPSQVLANGMIDIKTFVAFPFASPSTANVSWKNDKTTSLMDTYSHDLSGKDFKGNHVSTRYGYKSAKSVLNGTFAKYGEIAFSGAEDENISNNKKLEVKKGGGVLAPLPIYAHTGQKSLALDTKKTGFEYSVPVSELTIGRTYTVGVWVAKGPSKDVKLYYELDGVQKSVSESSLVSTKVSGNWVLVNFDIKVTAGNTVKVFAKNDGIEPVFIDDFRFQPKNSSSVASVYDEKTGELTYTLNQYNLFTKYEYNAMGQLVATYVEQFGRSPYKSSEAQLNYSTRNFIGLGN